MNRERMQQHAFELMAWAGKSPHGAVGNMAVIYKDERTGELFMGTNYVAPDGFVEAASELGKGIANALSNRMAAIDASIKEAAALGEDRNVHETEEA